MSAQMELLSFTHVSEWLKPISMGAKGIQDPMSGQQSTVQNLRTVAKIFFNCGHRQPNSPNIYWAKNQTLHQDWEEKDLHALYATQSHRAVTT
jgi:hypothetical protein